MSGEEIPEEEEMGKKDDQDKSRRQSELAL